MVPLTVSNDLSELFRVTVISCNLRFLSISKLVSALAESLAKRACDGNDRPNGAAVTAGAAKVNDRAEDWKFSKFQIPLTTTIADKYWLIFKQRKVLRDVCLSILNILIGLV